MTVQMPFAECLQRLDAHCDGQLLRGSEPVHIFPARVGGAFEGPYAAALRMMLDWAPVRDIDQAVSRNELIHALGPLRLEFQAHEAPSEAYRALARLIRAIDATFDELATDRPSDMPRTFP